jgi:hypothetical protein
MGVQFNKVKENKMKHSSIVGGSTAKRVIACPGSVALCATMPPKPSSKYADEGTLLHNVIAEILDKNVTPESLLGTKYQDQVLTQDHIDNKILPALAALKEIDPENQMDYAVESRVGFGEFIPNVYGSTDFLGRLNNKAVVLDWKFGDGVAVEVEENAQLMFYAAAAMRTKEVSWVFDGVSEIECIIVQPPAVKRWITTPERIRAFELELLMAVRESEKPEAKLIVGDHCRWCVAKPVCPNMTGAVDRALQNQIKAISVDKIGLYLQNADILEQWITDLRALAFQMLESDVKIPGYKLVAKRATRQWIDEDRAKNALLVNLKESDVMETSLISPAKAEKVLKKHGLTLPEDCVVAISSGNTLALESDPRPAVMQLGQQLTAALSKLQ